MAASPANLLRNLPTGREETFQTLLARPGIKLERIVSSGQITPLDAPFKQPHEEWVLLLSGAARLWLEDRGEIVLAPGDHLLIPANREHRVTFTQTEPATVWLALHLG